MSKNLRMQQINRLRRPRPAVIFRHAITAIVTAWALIQAFKQFRDVMWPPLRAFLHVWWVTLIGTCVVLFVGIILFLFKLNYQRMYGLAEVSFGLAVAWVSIIRAQATTDAASWLAVMAAAYLIVRGLSNYQDGLKAQAAKERARLRESGIRLGDLFKEK